jgi:hypothetical protein
MIRSNTSIHKLLLLVATLFVVSGCDSEHSLRAFIIDVETRLPIDSVSVLEVTRNKTVLTDSTGFLDYLNIVGGANPPDMKMIFTKSGYEVFEMSFPPFTRDTLSIKLTPE